MKAEHDPVTADEWLVRLVWFQRLQVDKSPSVSPSSFEPRADEFTGISLFRTACLAVVEQALDAVAADKRDRYAIVAVPVVLLDALGLTVVPDPISAVPGHVLVPELNAAGHADRSRRVEFAALKRQLAVAASQHIIRRPPP